MIRNWQTAISDIFGIPQCPKITGFFLKLPVDHELDYDHVP